MQPVPLLMGFGTELGYTVQLIHSVLEPWTVSLICVSYDSQVRRPMCPGHLSWTSSGLAAPGLSLCSYEARSGAVRLVSFAKFTMGTYLKLLEDMVKAQTVGLPPSTHERLPHKAHGVGAAALGYRAGRSAAQSVSEVTIGAAISSQLAEQELVKLAMGPRVTHRALDWASSGVKTQ